MSATRESFVVACAHCGRNNRVVEAKASAAQCGACKKSVFPDRPVVGSDATWKSEVEASAIPVLVDFWAPWCGPCRAIAPALESIAGNKVGRLKVVKINVDENPGVSARFGIQAIPTLMVFRGGKMVDQMRGALPKPAIEARLDQLQI
ncbi:MAG TPA: thioredoxin TrxC [Polyangia bacterium]